MITAEGTGMSTILQEATTEDTTSKEGTEMSATLQEAPEDETETAPKPPQETGA